MRVEGELIEGRFLARENRFRVVVQIADRPVAAHLPNPGRLEELLLRGQPVWLAVRRAPQRKTDYDLLAIRAPTGAWVSLDTRLPNDAVAEALAGERLTPLAGYERVRREVTHGRSRFDFSLEAAGRRPCLVEVKSVSLVIDRVGCFPDAVTARGRRHVLELAVAVEAGYRAVVVFVVQRDDAIAVRPYDETDPDFGEALREAVARGVEVYAYGCRVAPGRVEIDRPLPFYPTAADLSQHLSS
ncbi:MAG: DNA/RNA nuclease SfsA [Anaerolineae bacterium]